MIVPALVGAVVGLGLLCIVRGFVATPRTLDSALAALSEPNWPGANLAPAAGLDSYTYRVGAWIMRFFGADMSALRSDLLVANRTEEEHLLERLRTVVFFVLVPGLITGLVPYLASGSTIVAPGLIAAMSVFFAMLGWFFTDTQLRRHATARRKEFDSALVTYLGLVSMLTAAGSGVNEALWQSVDQGVGWPFRVLRTTLADARNRGVSPWDAMDDHAERLELSSLSELAATMRLGGTSGAHIRESIVTKARSLRTHQLAEIEQEANGKTSQMAGPTGLMMIGFVILMLYPALTVVLNI